AVQGYAEAEEGASDPDLDQDFAATQGTHDDRIVVTWKRVSGAKSYRLYRADDVTGPFEEPIATVSGTSYTDSDKAGNRLTRCHSYWYRLEVCTGTRCTFLPSGVEGWRGTRIEGEEVHGLAASDLEHPDRIRLTWDPLPGAYEYTIYRGDEENEIGTSDTNTYDDVYAGDNLLEARTWYRYWVRAEPDPDGACEPSELSDWAEGRASRLPGTPVDLSTSSRRGRITVRWREGNSIEPPTHYLIYRAPESDGPYVEIDEVSHTTLSYTDTDVSAGNTYWYRIAAVNDWGTSDFSEPISSTVP
ncbi:MAG: fibronectin type III domain-containing protein, partial [Candidatus Bipolaricaulota bacterium]